MLTIQNIYKELADELLVAKDCKTYRIMDVKSDTQKYMIAIVNIDNVYDQKLIKLNRERSKNFPNHYELSISGHNNCIMVRADMMSKDRFILYATDLIK